MYPTCLAASRTRCAHASLTRFGCLGRLSTRLAVVRLTPATFATSDRLAIAPLLAGDLYRLPNSFLNVHDFVELNELASSIPRRVRSVKRRRGFFQPVSPEPPEIE